MRKIADGEQYTSPATIDDPAILGRLARRSRGSGTPRSTWCCHRPGRRRRSALVIPELNGKLNGFAVRVPPPTESLVDLTVEAQRATSAQEVNQAGLV
jgi:glyceraldehyde-3-phosphate dehydrogenase/erythrose-4-phosphate dehydrogenase